MVKSVLTLPSKYAIIYIMIRHIAYRDLDDAPEVLLEGKILTLVALSVVPHPDNNGGDDLYYPIEPETYDRMFPGCLDCWVE